MDRNKKLGIGLAGISLTFAILAGVYLIVTSGGLPVAAFAWPAVGFMLGIAIIFFSFVEVGLQLDDEIEEFPELIEDDIQDFRSGTYTPTHLMIAATLAAAVIQLGMLLLYEKIYASWGPINVLLIALLVVALALVWSVRSGWFQNRQQRLPARVFWIPAAGWLICMFIGIYYAEPIEYGGRSQLEKSQAVISEGGQVSSPRGSYVFWRTADMAGGVIADFDCDDEGCLVMLLVAVVVVSVVASATIPHFWVVATMLLLTMMGVIALRELLYREGKF